MAFWKKKENESEEKCPLCGTVVSIEDIECPLCFYELKVSPRHQSLNITANEEDTLIGLLNSDLEDEEDDEERSRIVHVRSLSGSPPWTSLYLKIKLIIYFIIQH